MVEITYKHVIWQSVKHSLIVLIVFILLLLVLGRVVLANGYGLLNSSNYGDNVNMTVWADDFTGSPAAKCYEPTMIRLWLASKDGSCTDSYHWKCLIDNFVESTADSRVGGCFEISFSLYFDFSNNSLKKYTINKTIIDMSTALGNAGLFDVTIFNTSDVADYSNATLITGFTNMTTAGFLSISGANPSYFIINFSNTSVRYLKLYFHNRGTAMTPREIAFYGSQSTPPDSERPNCNITYPKNGSFINNNFFIYGNASDNFAITSIRTNDSLFNVASNITLDVGKTMIWNITPSGAVSDKSYSVNITFSDIVGNTKDCIANFTVDTLQPQIEIIEPSNKAIYTNNSAIFSLKCSDNNLFGFDFMIWNSTDEVYRNSTRNLTTTVYQLNVSMDFTTYLDNYYNITASCIDGHTGNYISDKLIVLTKDTIKVDNINIKSDSDSTISYKKEMDKYTYTFITNSTQQHKFTLTSNNKIYYIEKSKYKGHFITGNNWIDTEPYIPDKIIRVNDYEYNIYLTGKEFQFKSIGDLNNVTLKVDYALNRISAWINFTYPYNNSIINNTNEKLCYNMSFIPFAQPDYFNECYLSSYYQNLTMIFNNSLGLASSYYNTKTKVTKNCIDFTLYPDNIYNFYASCENNIFNIYNLTTGNIFINISNPYELNITWKGYNPPNGTTLINETHLEFQLLLNSDSNFSICTFFRNDTNLSSFEIYSGENNITELYPTELDTTYKYFVTCNFKEILLNTSVKIITIKNSKNIIGEDSLSSVLMKFVYMGIIALLFLIHFTLLIIGVLVFRGMGLVILSGILGILASVVALFMIGNIIGGLGYMFFVTYIAISCLFMAIAGFSRE